jgi:hypothetical protein
MFIRKELVLSGMIFFAFVSYSEGSTLKSSFNPNYTTQEGDSLKNKNKKPAKADPAKTNTETVIGGKDGVVITSTGEASPFDNLKNDEVFVDETVVKREIVLEEEFKLWRIYVQKGRKMTEYRKVQVPFGTYCKRNELDITEEAFHQETKDLPEGEVKRFKRDDYEAKDRERIDAEIRERYEIKVVPMDSTAAPAPAPQK